MVTYTFVTYIDIKVHESSIQLLAEQRWRWQTVLSSGAGHSSISAVLLQSCPLVLGVAHPFGCCGGFHSSDRTIPTAACRDREEGKSTTADSRVHAMLLQLRTVCCEAMQCEKLPSLVHVELQAR